MISKQPASGASVSPTAIARVLRETPEGLRVFCAAVDPSLLAWSPAPGEWSIGQPLGQLLGHLLDADEHAFAQRIRWMLDNPGGTIPRWSAALAAEARGSGDDPLALLAELAERRIGRTAFVAGLTPAQLAVGAHFPDRGEFLVSDFVVEWAWHDWDHTKQVMEILKQSAWGGFSEGMQKALAGG